VGAEAAAGGSSKSIRGLYNVRHAFIQSKGHYWGQLNVYTHIAFALIVRKQKMLRFLTTGKQQGLYDVLLLLGIMNTRKGLRPAQLLQ
jgi:hypothetical protein